MEIRENVTRRFRGTTSVMGTIFPGVIRDTEAPDSWSDTSIQPTHRCQRGKWLATERTTSTPNNQMAGVPDNKFAPSPGLLCTPWNASTRVYVLIAPRRASPMNGTVSTGFRLMTRGFRTIGFRTVNNIIFTRVFGTRWLTAGRTRLTIEQCESFRPTNSSTMRTANLGQSVNFDEVW